MRRRGHTDFPRRPCREAEFWDARFATLGKQGFELSGPSWLGRRPCYLCRMKIDVPPELAAIVEHLRATGQFENDEEILRVALVDLDRRART